MNNNNKEKEDKVKEKADIAVEETQNEVEEDKEKEDADIAAKETQNIPNFIRLILNTNWQVVVIIIS